MHVHCAAAAVSQRLHEFAKWCMQNLRMKCIFLTEKSHTILTQFFWRDAAVDWTWHNFRDSFCFVPILCLRVLSTPWKQKPTKSLCRAYVVEIVADWVRGFWEKMEILCGSLLGWEQRTRDNFKWFHDVFLCVSVPRTHVVFVTVAAIRRH